MPALPKGQNVPAVSDSDAQRKPFLRVVGNQPASNQSFTGAKLDWMTAVAYDRRLQPMNFRIPFFIAQHANDKTGKAFPSQETIADLCGINVKSVKRAVKRLHETGWLKIRRSRGYDPKNKKWETRNIYWLRHNNVQTMFDLMADSKRGRRNKKTTLSRDTRDPFTGDTHDPLTPSVKHLRKGRESTEGEGYSRDRELALVRVINGGK